METARVDVWGPLPEVAGVKRGQTFPRQAWERLRGPTSIAYGPVDARGRPEVVAAPRYVQINERL